MKKILIYREKVEEEGLVNWRFWGVERMVGVVEVVIWKVVVREYYIWISDFGDGVVKGWW